MAHGNELLTTAASDDENTTNTTEIDASETDVPEPAASTKKKRPKGREHKYGFWPSEGGCAG